MTLEVVVSLSGIEPGEWNGLAGNDPFLRHEFLSALHETGCAVTETGWTPQYLVLRDHGRLAGTMPLYLKTHSYGEYVFDWAWADAYYRHGLHYYPKLVSAVPFTPVTGRRTLTGDPRHDRELITAALVLARELGVSSLHCLYPTAKQAEDMAGCGMMLRHGVQFHWVNQGYASFGHFLAGMTHDKRKKIRQERRKLKDAGISFRWLEGEAIGAGDWTFFARCYRRTYRAHQSTPYLNLDFFRRIGRTMPENLMLVLAERGGEPIAAALNVHNGKRLFGRYWGALEYHSGLHFETCYYQGIEYCIARGLAAFEGGARGEHKLARGMQPVATVSTHWLAHSRFSAAIAQFLAREGKGVEHYLDELNERRPFKEQVPDKG
jgi:uncharacterized protein